MENIRRVVVLGSKTAEVILSRVAVWKSETAEVILPSRRCSKFNQIRIGTEGYFGRYGYGFRTYLLQQRNAIGHPSSQRVTCQVSGYWLRSAGGEEHWSLIGEDPSL